MCLQNAWRVVSIWYTLSSVPHVFWIISFLCWSNMLILDPEDFNTLDFFLCTMTHLPSKKSFYPNKIPKNTAHGRHFSWGTDNKVYQNTVPNWHYPAVVSNIIWSCSCQTVNCFPFRLPQGSFWSKMHYPHRRNI